MSADRERPDLVLVTSSQPTQWTIISREQERSLLWQQECEALRQQVTDLRSDIRGMERSNGALRVEAKDMADLAHQARRDQWITILACAVVCLLVFGLCAWALVTT